MRKVRPSFLRFSLRALLCLTTVACVGLGWWTYRAREQASAVRALCRLGATKVEYACTDESQWAPGWLLDSLGRDYFIAVAHVKLRTKPLDLAHAAAVLQRLPGDTTVAAAVPAASPGAGLAALLPVADRVTRLSIQAPYLQPREVHKWNRRLGLFESSPLPDLSPTVAAEELDLLPSFERLEYLTIGGARLNAECLAQLIPCSSLTELELRYCQFEQRDLSQLSCIPKLQRFHLCDDSQLPDVRPTALLASPVDEANAPPRLEDLLPGIAIQRSSIVTYHAQIDFSTIPITESAFD